MELIHESVPRAIKTVSRYQDLPAIGTSNQLVKPGPVPVNLPSAIRHEAQKSNRRTIHLTNPCIDPPWLKHLLFSALAIDLSIYVKDKNSFTEKVSYDLTSLGFFLCFWKNYEQVKTEGVLHRWSKAPLVFMSLFFFL